VPGWYDVDDAASFRMLEEELAGGGPFAQASGARAEALATRRFMQERQAALAGAM
jgi:hypothetical protein